jgi:hypothetical protein
MGAANRDLVSLLVVLGLFQLLQHGHAQVYPYGNDPRQPHVSQQRLTCAPEHDKEINMQRKRSKDI